MRDLTPNFELKWNHFIDTLGTNAYENIVCVIYLKKNYVILILLVVFYFSQGPIFGPVKLLLSAYRNGHTRLTFSKKKYWGTCFYDVLFISNATNERYVLIAKRVKTDLIKYIRSI